MLSFHTIAALVFHVNDFVNATIAVLKGGPLDASDQLSFNCPPISSEGDWKALLQKTRTDAEELANLTEQMPEQYDSLTAWMESLVDAFSQAIA